MGGGIVRVESKSFFQVGRGFLKSSFPQELGRRVVISFRQDCSLGLFVQFTGPAQLDRCFIRFPSLPEYPAQIVMNGCIAGKQFGRAKQFRGSFLKPVSPR